jgi:hypothetical protein
MSDGWERGRIYLSLLAFGMINEGFGGANMELHDDGDVSSA